MTSLTVLKVTGGGRDGEAGSRASAPLVDSHSLWQRSTLGKLSRWVDNRNPGTFRWEVPRVTQVLSISINSKALPQ
jgi:hypothetical protein